MGLAYNHLKLIEELYTNNGVTNHCLFLGRQWLDLGDKRIHKLVEKYCGKLNWTEKFVFADQLIMKFGWIRKIDNLDISNFEGANIIKNLNQNFKLRKKYDFIVDGGTLEHVFNVHTALNSLTNNLKIGGTIIHLNPSNNWNGHGLYQFSPGFYSTFYNDFNGYRNTKIFVIKSDNPKKIYKVNTNFEARLGLKSQSRLECVVITQLHSRVKRKRLYQKDYEVLWNGVKTQSKSSLLSTKLNFVNRLRIMVQKYSLSSIIYQNLFSIIYKVKRYDNVNERNLRLKRVENFLIE